MRRDNLKGFNKMKLAQSTLILCMLAMSGVYIARIAENSNEAFCYSIQEKNPDQFIKYCK